MSERGWFIAFMLGLVFFLSGWNIGRYTSERARVAIYEQGVVDGLKLAGPKPEPVTCAEVPSELVPDGALLAECRSTFADYRRTEAANRENARDLGKDEGLRLGREDWHSCGAWERERLR